jgi:hypothetical protein
MLDGHDGHDHAGHPSNVAGRRPGRVDHDLGGDPPPVGQHRAHPATGHLHAGDPGAGVDPHAQRAGAVGQGPGQQRGLQVAVARQPAGEQHVPDVQQCQLVRRLGRVEQMHLQPVRGGGARLSLQLLDPLRRGGQPESAHAAPAGVATGQLAQFGIECRGVHDHAGLADGRTQLPHEAGRVPRGAVRQIVLLHKHHIGPTQARQVVGDAAAGHAAADDDRTRTRRQIHGHDAVVPPRASALNGLNEYLIPVRAGIDDPDRHGPHSVHHDADHVGPVGNNAGPDAFGLFSADGGAQAWRRFR